MSTFDVKPGERVKTVRCTEDELIVGLLDGRTISVPLAWYPRLLHATPQQRANWRLAGGATASTGPTLTKTSPRPACSVARLRPVLHQRLHNYD